MDHRTGTSAARWGKAVVIGGGYAGLVTARVLADHFDEVTILERDPVDETTGVHPHVPQGYHAHAMLAKGSEILETLFPGLRAELQDLGAPVFDYVSPGSSIWWPRPRLSSTPRSSSKS